MSNSKIYYDRLFPYIDRDRLNKLMIDKASISYITTPSAAKQICKIIRYCFNKHNVKTNSIVDCTGCVGGDTIAFASVFDEVISVEVDPVRCVMLENNINTYGFKNVKVYNEDCLKLLKDIEYSQAVYFDPPWGGSEYKIRDKLRLFINNDSIEKITVDLICRRYTKKPPKFIIFKLPKNYDIQYFFKQVRIKEELDIYLYRLKKINLIVVINKYNDNENVIIE